MKRTDPQDKEFCWACGAPARERDHFPMPARFGGGRLFPLCVTCHDLKDRHPIEKWNASNAFLAISGLINRASRDEKIVLMKLIVMVAEANAGQTPVPGHGVEPPGTP